MNSIFQNGIKNAEFLVLNPLNIELTDEVPEFASVVLTDSEFWREIRSATWSSGCRFFFVINEDSTIIGNAHDGHALKTNHSKMIFSEFFNHFTGTTGK